MTRGVSPWRALAQSGISLKWEDPRTTWSGCLKRNPRPSGRGVCQQVVSKDPLRELIFTEA